MTGAIFWGVIFVLWYRNGWNFIPEFLISFVGIFVCLVFAAKICNTKLGLCLADVGKYSLQLYLLDGYFLGASPDGSGAIAGLYKSGCDCSREYSVGTWWERFG